MLENVDLKRRLSREEYAKALPGLQRRLYDLEKACWDQNIPSIILMEGWDAAGKGAAISALTQRLDARGFKLHSIQPPSVWEQEYPWLWRFWLKIPNRGEMGIFARSWYMRVLSGRVEKAVSKREWRAAFDDIQDFERMLADDGMVLVKLFLHISKREQKRRMKKLAADPLQSWRVTAEDRARNRKYDEYAEAVEDVLALTEAAHAPWTIVEATSRWWARKKIFDTIIAALEHRLGTAAPPYHASRDVAEHEADLRAAMESLEVPEEASDAGDA